MENQFKLKILLPNKKFYDNYIYKLNFLSLGGWLTIYANHQNTIGVINKCEKAYFIDKNGQKNEIIIGEGIFKFYKNEIILMIDLCEYIYVNTKIDNTELYRKKLITESIKQKQINDNTFETLMLKLEEEVSTIEKKHH